MKRRSSNGTRQENGGEYGDTGKMVFWNVAGVSNKDKDFWNYIRNFEFVGLTETWVEEKGWERLKSRLPIGFEWKCQYAIREKKKDRAMGGIITGVKREWVSKKTEREEINIVERRMKVGNNDWRVAIGRE